MYVLQGYTANLKTKQFHALDKIVLIRVYVLQLFNCHYQSQNLTKCGKLYTKSNIVVNIPQLLFNRIF